MLGAHAVNWTQQPLIAWRTVFFPSPRNPRLLKCVTISFSQQLALCLFVLQCHSLLVKQHLSIIYEAFGDAPIHSDALSDGGDWLWNTKKPVISGPHSSRLRGRGLQEGQREWCTKSLCSAFKQSIQIIWFTYCEEEFYTNIQQK